MSEEKKEYGPDECQECGQIYELKDGYESTGFCHECELTSLRAQVERLEKENYTGVLIDRLNELVRENRKFFMECCDGPTAADLIQQIHSDFNQLKESRHRLEECEKALREKESK